MDKQKNCIFCKIIQGELPSVSITKTDNMFIFLDINPVNKGHLLVVPTIHAETIFDFSENLGTELIQLMKKLGSALMHAMHADGLNILQNNYVAAGQEVPHIHWHLVPRFTNDQHPLHPWKRNKYNDSQEMQTIANKIISILYEKYS